MQPVGLSRRKTNDPKSALAQLLADRVDLLELGFARRLTEDVRDGEILVAHGSNDAANEEELLAASED